ncbi:hypothetical protein Tco_0992929 [Tanacetum coccineum]|uniref:Gag-Pol polyprotein n=1 Tax=Tanacetum coccineum TaxID=301880 RepID=A0ABQ5F3W8_9ASTR
MIPNPANDQEEILEALSKMIEGNKKQYIADVKVMNYLLQAIPNDIYNLVDACYGGNGNNNARRQNRKQVFNAVTGNDERNQIVQRVPRTESTLGHANVQCYNCNEKADDNAETVPSYDAKAVSEVNASSKVHEQNPERLKKAIAAQPKMYDGEKLHSAKLIFDSPDSEETLEDAEESQLKMRNKMVQINYAKLNALYEIFVPQQDFFVEQPYFLIPSTSTNGSESKEVTSDLPLPKMPKEIKLLKMFDKMGVAINGL